MTPNPHHHHRRPACAAALLGALLLALGAPACSEGALDAPLGTCSGDNDCVDGRVCDFNYCVAPGANQLVMQARVVPPANTDLLPQQVPVLTFAEGPDRLIRLVEPAVVRGVVRPRGDSFTVNIPGELEVTTPGDLMGLDYRFSARVVDGVDASGLGFTLRLLPGRRYAGTFRADDRALPPFTFTLEPEAIATGRFDVLLPNRADYVEISGRVRAIDYTPIGDARVVALREDNSVVGITTSEPQRGQFSLTLPPDATSVRLKVSAPDEGVVFPDFTTELLSAAADLDLVVPALPIGASVIDVAVEVVGRDEFGLRQPVPGLTVNIIGDVSGGLLRRSAVTDADGVAIIRALPGEYECLISTSPDAPWASWHGRVRLDTYGAVPAYLPDVGEAVAIELAPRARLAGTVHDASGEPVARGAIHATRRVAREPDHLLTLAPPPFKANIVAGHYELLVDPGVYDLRVAPDADTGAPPTTLRGHEVIGQVELPIDLPEPALAHLTVARPDGTFLPGATIELYEVHDGAPALLTKGTTSDGGYVDLLIPYAP